MYIENNLAAGEKVVYTTRLSAWPLLPSYLIGIILIPIVIGLFVLIRTMLLRRCTEIAVTNRRLIAKFGVFQTRVYDMPLSRVESVRVDQTFLGRIFSYGDVHVAGTGSTVEPLLNISTPAALRNALLQASDQGGGSR